MATYKGILTNNGKALLASATVANPVNYSHLAVGDGNGSTPTPLETRSALVNEKARIALNVVEINPNQTNQIICEAIIPTNIGGFHIREFGLFAGSVMIVNGNYPLTYKPAVNEGGAREIAIKVIINVQNAEVIALYLDDSLIYATREWVKNNYIPRADIIDNLTTNDATKPVSAKQAKVLNDKVESIEFGAGGLKDKVEKTDPRLSDSREWTAETVSQAEAESGTATTRRAWTAQRVRQAATAMFNAVTTTFTRTLLSRATAAQVRSDLGLGNAATSNVINNLTTNDASSPLSAAMGKNLNDGKVDVPVSIPINSDLNNYTTAGFYYCSVDEIAITIENNPTNYSFSLLVEKTAGVNQKLTVYGNGGGRTYTRSFYSTWTEWKISATIDDNVASATVSANCSGNSTTATRLHTARYIENALFNGSYDITINSITSMPNYGYDPSYLNNSKLQLMFSTLSSNQGSADYCDLLTLNSWYDSTGGLVNAIAANKTGGGLYHWQGEFGGSVWSTKKQLAYTDSNVASATKLQTARNISLSGAITGSANFDGSGNIDINTTLQVGLGVGQSWINMTASRSFGTTFRNTTGSPIEISVTSKYGTSNFRVLINGNIVSDNFSTYNSGEPYHNITITVPNNAEYSAIGGTLARWWELR